MRELLSYKTAASIKEMYGCNTQYNLQKNCGSVATRCPYWISK